MIALGPPFTAQTDTTRLQMATKQFAQTLVHETCEIPYVITREMLGLSFPPLVIRAHKDCEVEKYGRLLLVDDKVYWVEDFLAGTPLRYVKTGKVHEGEVICEYVGFKNGIVTSGWNSVVAFLPFFGYNYEDAIVVSERFAKKTVHTTVEEYLIPVYEDTTIYEAPDKIHCEGNIKFRWSSKTTIDTISDLVDFIFGRSANDELVIENAKWIQIRTYKIARKPKLLSKSTEEIVSKLYKQYVAQLRGEVEAVSKVLPTFVHDYLNRLIITMDDVRINDLFPYRSKLQYIIHVIARFDKDLKVGDKLCNRYANKGVVSLIIPNELTPEYQDTDGSWKKIEVLLNPLGLFARMNMGQVWELYIARIVKKLWSEGDEKNFQKLCELLKAPEQEFKPYLIVDKISYFDVDRVYAFINEQLGGTVTKVRYKRELLEWLKDNYGADFDWPITGDVYVQASVGIQYIQKLKQTAESKINVRDLGPYRIITKQPTRGKKKSGGSRIGYMEIDALIAHGALDTLKELTTIKSDCVDEKVKMVKDMVSDRKPDLKNVKSYTKRTVDHIMAALSEML